MVNFIKALSFNKNIFFFFVNEYSWYYFVFKPHEITLSNNLFFFQSRQLKIMYAIPLKDVENASYYYESLSLVLLCYVLWTELWPYVLKTFENEFVLVLKKRKKSSNRNIVFNIINCFWLDDFGVWVWYSYSKVVWL